MNYPPAFKVILHLKGDSSFEDNRLNIKIQSTPRHDYSKTF